MFLSGQPPPPSQGSEAQRTRKKIGDPLCGNGLTYNNEIWYDNTRGRIVFPGVSHAPILMGSGPGVLKNFGTSYVRAQSMRSNNELLHGDQTRCEENFTGSTVRLS